MDWDEEDDNPYKTETLTSLKQWRARQLIYQPGNNNPENVDIVMEGLESNITRSRKTYNIYTDEQKALFLYLLNFKFLKAAPAGEQTGIWAKRTREYLEWDIYAKLTNKVNRAESQLQEAHKHSLINFFDEKPQATRKDTIDGLTTTVKGFGLKESQVGTLIKDERNLAVKRITRRPMTRNSKDTLIKRKEWEKKWSQTDMGYLSNCVFVDESDFDINIRPSTARSAKGTPAIITTPSARAVPHTILGAISVMDVVNIEIMLPNSKPKRVNVDGSRKRK